jgi:hypothetical protein
MIIKRRSFLTGLASALAAPAIVRASSLMPVRGIIVPWRVPLVGGTTLYVEMIGNDSNDGLSPLSAFRTLQRAYECVGDLNLDGAPITIEVGAGDYPSLVEKRD